MYPALQSAGYGFFYLRAQTGTTVQLAHRFDFAFHGDEFITAVVDVDGG